MGLPVEDEKQLAIGGFQGIKKFRGLLVAIDVQDPPDNWDNQERQVVKVDTEESVVLEMFGDEEIFDLKDGKFSFYIPYTEAGKNPHQNSIYGRCWMGSAKELGKKPSEFIGSYCTFEKQPRLLFDKYIKESDLSGEVDYVLDDEGNKKTKEIKGETYFLVHIRAVNQAGLPNHFCFVGDESADSENIKEYARDKLVGLNQKAALRKLLVDVKLKQFKEFRDKHNAGTLAEYLGLVIVEDKYQKPEGADA